MILKAAFKFIVNSTLHRISSYFFSFILRFPNIEYRQFLTFLFFFDSSWEEFIGKTSKCRKVDLKVDDNKFKFIFRFIFCTAR